MNKLEKYIGLEEYLDKSQILYNEPMHRHTTMKVGGNCTCMVLPESIKQIQDVLKYAKINDLKYYVIGNGSNLLVKDEGIDALIIKIFSKFKNVVVEDDLIVAEVGCTMPKVALVAKQYGLTGFEFACGIPGTIGGGVRMNAGAYGGELGDIIEEVTYINDVCELCTIKKEDMKLSYRHTIFSENPNYIIVSVRFKLQKGDISQIESKMNENKQARISKQPLEYPNAGSVFTRPEGYFVGKLVQDAGLRGKTIGGAQVSTKHTGFIVNVGNATCKDVLDLIAYIQNEVFSKFGVQLKTEVIIIGGEK